MKQYLDVTSWRVRNVLEGIRIGVELSVVFRVFPAVFARSLLIEQRRENVGRLVHEDDERFWVLFRSINHLLFGISHVKNFLRS